MSRLFFGLEVPDEIKQRLLQLQAPVSGARWQTGAQLHITLLFLGSVEQSNAAAVCAAARDLPMCRFELEIAGLGCFGQPHQPRHLWAGVQPLAAISELREALTVRMAALGFTPDARPFCPHVTVSRFGKRPGSVEALLANHHDAVFGHYSVTEFVLFESSPGEHGSAYGVVERFRLTNPSPATKD